MRATSKETQGNGRRSTVANSSVTQTAAAAAAELHSGLQHSRLALGPCLGGAFKHSDVLCSARRRRRREKDNSSSVPVCSWHTSPHVCIGGSPLSGRIKGRNVFELFPSPPSVSPTHLPTHPPTPKAPTRGRVYTLFIKTTVWEKNGAIISPALMGCICLVSLSAVQWWRVCVFHEHICMLGHFRSVPHG